MLYAIVGLLFLLADQFLKFWTVTNIDLNAYPGKELLGGLFHLTHIENSGIFFGFLGGVPALRWILLVLLLAFAAFIIMGIRVGYLRTGFARWTGSLLLAGLVGNGADRAIYGFVVDMIEPTIGSLHLPIFNIADVLVTVFGILFCIALITGGIGAPAEDDDEDGDEERPRRRFRWEEEDEDEDEEEEEEYRPRRRARRVEEDEEEEPPRRHRRPEAAEEPRRRPRQEGEAVHRRLREEGETPRRAGEQVPARRRPEAAEAPVRRPAAAQTARPTAQTARPAAQPDPRQHREDFENALNGRPVRRPAPAAQAAPTTQTAQTAEAPVTTVRRPAPAAPVRPAAPAAPTQPVAPVAPTQPAAPQSAPAPVQETPKPAADEFDLDSILAEFK